MRYAHHFKLMIAIAGCLAAIASTAAAFEGRIHAVTTLGGQTEVMLYTVGTNFLRVELTATNWPNPVDILDLNSGALTLLFPHNRSFVRLKPATENLSAPAPDAPQMQLPPGTGPQSPTAPAPGVPAMPTMPAALGTPAMPAMPRPMEKLELKATGETTHLLGFACARYELKQRGETMEIWATDQLLPFQNYVRNPPPRFGPRMIEEQWPELLKAKKLFPLLASLKFENGVERLRFEVKTLTPEKIEDRDGSLFQPPPDYQEIQPLPF